MRQSYFYFRLEGTGSAFLDNLSSDRLDLTCSTYSVSLGGFSTGFLTIDFKRIVNL